MAHRGTIDPTRIARVRGWLEVSTSHSPSIGYDGHEVLYVASDSYGASAYRVGFTGGTPTRLVASPEPVGRILACPGRPRAVIATEARGGRGWQLALLDLPADGADPVGRPLTDAPQALHIPGAWRPDGRRFLYTSNQRDPRSLDVYERDVDEPSTARRLWEGGGPAVVLDARATSALLARANSELDVDLIELRDGTATTVNPHEGELPVTSATLGAEATYAGANPGREWCALVRYRRGNSGHEYLREYPGDVELVRADPTGERLALVVNREGVSELHIFDLGTSEDRRVPVSPRGVIGGLDWAPGGRELAFDLSSSDGREIVRLDPESGKSRRLTRPVTPVPARAAEPKLGRIRAVDGVTIAYWEYVAPGGSPTGTIVSLFGGAERQARPRFDAPVQILAQEGWRVVGPNVRGSAGHGRAFAHLADGDRRGDSARDLRDLVLALGRDGKAPPGRIGIVGTDRAGGLVLQAIATYPELFRAAVCLVGVSGITPSLPVPESGRVLSIDLDGRGTLTSLESILSTSRRSPDGMHRTPLLYIQGPSDSAGAVRAAEDWAATSSDSAPPWERVVLDGEGPEADLRPEFVAAWARAAEFLERELGPAQG